MTLDSHRPTEVLEDRSDLSTAVVRAVRRTAAPEDETAPRGWGSAEDRRTMRWALVGFALLAAYAVVFVLIGERAWT